MADTENTSPQWFIRSLGQLLASAFEAGISDADIVEGLETARKVVDERQPAAAVPGGPQS